MKKNQTLSIGIPAYNEEKTIRELILSLLAQQISGYALLEIVVVSDGSTDATVKRIKEINDRRIRVIQQTTRQGKPAGLQKIIRIFKGDILILIDADVTITDKNLLQSMLRSSHFPKNGLITVKAVPFNVSNIFTQSLNAGAEVVNEISKRWRDGDNFLSFKGRFLAMSRDFAKMTTIPSAVVNDDAYLYFLAKKHGYSPGYITNTHIYYRSPRTFSDHMKQSSRYQGSYEELKKYFGDAIKNEYKIPVTILVISMARVFLKNPLSFAGYLLISILSKVFRNKNLSSTWAIAHSTKNSLQR